MNFEETLKKLSINNINTFKIPIDKYIEENKILERYKKIKNIQERIKKLERIQEKVNRKKLKANSITFFDSIQKLKESR
jgi:ppGpp synthetase/RelA/SpoT-type nucleotidyltranferase